MLLVSVIIPVYNVEKYIHKCLDSIIAQTYRNWEAILVDDGSPDMCGKICDEYARKDKRFKVIHQMNGGVSVARQTGLENATGDYIIHCDPDDWIEPTMFEELTQKVEDENAEMVIFDFIIHDNGCELYHSQELPPLATAKSVQTMIIDGKLHGSCCNKLIKASLCKKTGFFPSHISYCEDELFNVKLLNEDIKIAYLPRGLYHYIHHKDSISYPSIQRINSRTAVLDELKKHANSQNDFFNIKKDILIAAFLSKKFNLLKEKYTEIHEEIILAGAKYNNRAPLKSCLSIALTGYPHFAYYIYKLNMLVIRLAKTIRRK